MPMAHLLAVDYQKSVMGRSGQALRAYSPYGASSQQGVQIVAFCGERCDLLMGGYHLGNGRRLYNPTLMRFLSPDTLSPFQQGGVNAYAYCGGDPVNRIDPGAQFWRRILGAFSSSVTASGAVVRTAKNEALRLQHAHLVATGQPSTYTTPPLLNRIGNTAFAATGTAGITGNILLGAESGWMDDSLITLANGFGIANATGNITGGITSNLQTARDVWALMGQPGIPASSVVFGTFVEVMGLRMLGEAVSYAGRQSRAFASRFTRAVGAGIDAWRQRPPANIQMTSVRRDSRSP